MHNQWPNSGAYQAYQPGTSGQNQLNRSYEGSAI